MDKEDQKPFYRRRDKNNKNRSDNNFDEIDGAQFSRPKRKIKPSPDKFNYSADGEQFSRPHSKLTQSQSDSTFDSVDGARFSRQQLKPGQIVANNSQAGDSNMSVYYDLNAEDGDEVCLRRPKGLQRQKSYSEQDLTGIKKGKFLTPKSLKDQNSSSNSLYKKDKPFSKSQSRSSGQFSRYKPKDNCSTSGDESDASQFIRKSSVLLNSGKSSSLSRPPSIPKEVSEQLRNSTGNIHEDVERCRNGSGTKMRSKPELTDSIPSFYILTEDEDNNVQFETAIENGNASYEDPVESVPEQVPMMPGQLSQSQGFWNTKKRRYITKTVPVLFGTILFLLDVYTDIKLAISYETVGK